jgi:Tfp pilus assembly protein PilN
MIEINLLPKEYLKSSRGLSLGKAGMYALAGAAGIIVVLAGLTGYQMYQVGKLDSDIAKARQRAAVLQKDIQLVDALLDVKQKIGDRMKAVERLDRNRSAWVRVLEDIARNVPEFVWLASFEEKPAPKPDSTAANANANNTQGETSDGTPPTQVRAHELPSVFPVEIEGYAFTLNALAAFMINVMRSDYFDDVQLHATTETSFNEQGKAYNFVLTCSLHYLSDEELQNLIAQSEDEASKSSTSHRTLN